MGLFQKRHKIEDINNITKKVLLSNSYSAFNAAKKDISPKFEKLKFRAPNEQVTSSSVQGLIDDLNQKRQKEQEEQKQINIKKTEASQLKNETQGYKLNFIAKRDQLSKELLEIRNNKELLLNEKIRPLESKYEKLVNERKSIINIGNIFGDSSKISKNATSKQKKEIDEQQNKNYADNNGNYYEDQFKRLGNIKSLYDRIQQNKYLKQLKEMGEVPCDKIYTRVQTLKEQNRQLEEKINTYYWFASHEKEIAQRDKNNKIISIYKAMSKDKNDDSNIIWQGFENNQRQYLSNKYQNKSFVGKWLSSEVTSLFSKEVLEREESELSNSTYFKDKAYNAERKRIIKEFEMNSLIIDEEDKKISEKEKDIKENDKKIKDCDDVIRRLDEIINYTPSMLAKMVGSIIKGAKGIIGDKSGHNPINLINTIKSQNESIYKTLSNPTVDIYEYLETMEIYNGGTPKNHEGFYDFTQIAKYKVFYDNCLKWKNKDCIQYYKYLYWIRHSDSQLDSYIESYYNKTDDKSKALNLKNDMFKSTHIAKTSVSYAKKCTEMGEKLCQDKLRQDDESLAKVYKQVSKSINSIYIDIEKNSSGEIEKNSKSYNNINKFKKLKVSKKEQTLKVYDENLSLITNFKHLSTSLGIDLYNINSGGLSQSQKACQDLIKNIGVKQLQAQKFNEELNKRKTQIEQETNDIRDFTANQAKQKGVMKSFALPQLPQNTLTKESSDRNCLSYYKDYFLTAMKIDETIRRNFSNNKKLFKKNPYFTKIWVESMRRKVRSLKETSELLHNQFKGFDKTENQDLLKETQKLYLKAKRQLARYDEYFSKIESGWSIYNDMDIGALFSETFWTDLRTALNETVNLLQDMGFDGRYKEILRDISFAKALKHSGSLIRFYKYWVENISSPFLNFSLLFQGAIDKSKEAYDDAKLNKEGYIKALKDGKEEFTRNINLILFPEFFDTKKVISIDSVLGVLKSPAKIKGVIDAFNKIDRKLYTKQYEIKDKYEKQKENSSRLNSTYEQKLRLIEKLNR